MSDQDPLGIDIPAVEGWMRELTLEVEPPLKVQPLGGGRSNLTFTAQDAVGRRWVLRRPPLGRILSSAHDVVREHGILDRLAATDVPTPRPIALSQDPAISSSPLILMEYVDGIVIDDEATAATLSESQRKAVSLSLATTLASIHAVDLAETGLADLASHASYAQRQLKRWRRQWESTKTSEVPVVEELHDRLARNAPEQREVTLVHGDYHLLNAIVDPAAGTVRAIVDWELCTLGDPLADLGGLQAYWRQSSDPPIAGLPMPTTLPGFASRRELALAYAERSGRDLSALPFWEALAYWKIAIIIEGVRRRALDGPQGEPPMEAAIVTDLLERGVDAAAAAGCS